MDAHAIEVLEFARVRALLAEGAASALGVAACEAVQPTDDPFRVRRWLQLTSEARSILDVGGDLPLGGLHDLTPLLRQAGIGSVLVGSDLRQVAQTVHCIGAVKAYLLDHEQLTALADLGAQLTEFPDLAAEIDRCIGDDGEVLDSASPELRGFRRKVRQVSGQIEETLARILARIATDETVQDAVVTIREGRYCIPVKSSFQHRFSGLIHDRSASGQTVFMEPSEVVRLNNELRDAQLSEREEVHRILTSLTGAVASHRRALEDDLRLMTQLDLTRAKARLSVRLECTAPALDDSGRFELKQARHPLLVTTATPDHRIVPTDLSLGDEYHTLLVTGPNTGGKTVALKTIGLLTLMAHAGLHIPADQGSRIAVCSDVFADIGDEQSIEQSLSTFGSHLKQIVHILKGADERALVLLDEVGAGTDPVEGAALAEAILAKLHERACRVVATTHHGSLKAFAFDTPEVENASVEFDAASLAPTYRLLAGIPGASHAFEIAARFGLDAEVLARARQLLPDEHHEASDIIVQMQHRRQRLDTELRSAEHEAAAASNQRRELERERQRLRELEIEIREEARREAETLLAKVQNEAEQILADLRRAPRENKATEQARQRLRQVREQVKSPGTAKAPRATEPGRIEAGDQVEVHNLRRVGTVLDVAEDGDLEVQVGPMRLTAGPLDVTLVKKAGPAKPPPKPKVTVDSSFELELHVRGETVDDALIMVESYLDRALLANVPEIRIVHGKGTGTLRRVVHEYLREHPHVTSFGHPPEALGGRGVTVAKLAL